MSHLRTDAQGCIDCRHLKRELEAVRAERDRWVQRMQTLERRQRMAIEALAGDRDSHPGD